MNTGGIREEFARHILSVHVPQVFQRLDGHDRGSPYHFFFGWWNREALVVNPACSFDVALAKKVGRNYLESKGFRHFPKELRDELIQRSIDLFQASLEEERATQTLALERLELEKAIAKEAEFNKSEIRRQVVDSLNLDFLKQLREIGSTGFEGLSRAESEHVVSDFVRTWSANHLGFNLDFEQAAAVASVSNHTRVVARAGSGKTSVMAIRAVFLVEHCRVQPSELLLMAFNRSAKQELQNRISKLTLLARGLLKPNSSDLANSNFIDNLIHQHQIELPWVATFDSVARSITNAGPIEKRDLVLLDDSGQKRLIDQISRDFLKDPERYAELKVVMLQHFKDDWDKLIAFEESMVGSFQNELPKETLLGERVKSFGEKRIADWLFSHEVEYKYEKSLWLDEGHVFPDFTVEFNSKKLIIEYLGMQGDSHYDRNSSLKRESYKKKNIEVLELTIEQIASGHFEQLLMESLTRCFTDLNLTRLSVDALWAKIQNVSESRFRKNVASFVDRVRRSKVSVSAWRQKSLEILFDEPVALGFTKLALEICEIYEEKLKREGLQDFIGVMIESITQLRRGQLITYTSGGRERRLSDLKFICMDEYQDFSNLYEELVEQLVALGNKPLLFAVGDNWQSINSYMGAEPKLFEGFERKWPNSASKNITGNYRSAQIIVETGNSVMSRSGETPGRVVKTELGQRVVLKSDELQISPWERESFEGDEKSAGIVRIIQTHLRRYPGDTITLLTRTNSIPWWFPGKSSFLKNLENYLEFLKKQIPEESHSQLAISTVNKFKGLESSAVIILDALDVSFPLIHKDSRLMSLFGVEISELLEEERRLFYVATTRPRSALYILTRSGHESRFIESFATVSGDWSLFNSEQKRGARIVCRGLESIEIKEALKEAKFKWDAAKKEWSISIQKFADTMSPEEILNAIKESGRPWVHQSRAAGVEVLVLIDGEEYPVSF